MLRRKFICSAATAAAGIAGMGTPAFAGNINPAYQDADQLYLIGPVEGYSPQVGTLVSMLNYNRSTIIGVTKNLAVAELDYLHDPKANTIAGLLMHLAAVEKYYQVNSFEGRQEFNDKEKKIWDDGMNLGDAGRKNIKGRDLNHYLNILAEVRQHTLDELKKKDDKWLMEIDKVWSTDTEKINTYWKWFHVCEHESNHRGQISWLKSRLPGAKASAD
ncbi:MAG TPA: DinB family protein [Chitinophagaceae bacterium]|nr:DinB family protein [Chitinophagaceae bacterium]